MRSAKYFKDNKGVVLLVTLAVISVIVAAAIELNRRARLALESTAASRNRLTLMEMASSGVHIAMAILIQDKINDPPSGLDSIQEDWANPEIIDQLLAAIPFEEGKLKIKITDELGKIQVNTVVKFPEGKEANDPQMFLWDRFLRLLKLSDDSTDVEDPRTIVNSLKDWLDSGDDDAVTGINGAESDYYLGLDPPYECKNGPLTDLEELVLIKGITPELYYGIEGSLGISNYMTTVFGPLAEGVNSYYTGKINLNTADLPVIAALLPTGNETLATEIIKFREEKSESKFIHDISNPRWYKNAPGCSELEIDSNLVTTFSDFFQVKATAVIEPLAVNVIAVVQRIKDKNSGKWICKVLSWRTE
jgi:general secretion pathway protein K